MKNNIKEELSYGTKYKIKDLFNRNNYENIDFYEALNEEILDKNLIKEFIRLKAVEKDYNALKLKNLLTRTELKILYLVYNGHSQSSIAKLLFISIRTVKSHISNILKKTGLNSSRKVAIIAKEYNLF